MWGVAVTFAADHDHHKAVKVAQLSQRDIIEKLDGKAASATEASRHPGGSTPVHQFSRTDGDMIKFASFSSLPGNTSFA